MTAHSILFTVAICSFVILVGGQLVERFKN
jgi:hypothetical protein